MGRIHKFIIYLGRKRKWEWWLGSLGKGGGNESLQQHWSACNQAHHCRKYVRSEMITFQKIPQTVMHLHREANLYRSWPHDLKAFEDPVIVATGFDSADQTLSNWYCSIQLYALMYCSGMGWMYWSGCICIWCCGMYEGTGAMAYCGFAARLRACVGLAA